MQKPALKPFHVCAITRGRKRRVIILQTRAETSSRELLNVTQHLEEPVPGPEGPAPPRASAFPQWVRGQGGGGEHRLRDHQTGLQPAPDNSCLGPLRLFLQLYNGNDNFSIWTVDYWMIIWNKETLQKRGDHIFWDGKELSPGQGVHFDGQEEFIKQKEGRFSRRCTIIKAYLHWWLVWFA